MITRLSVFILTLLIFAAAGIKAQTELINAGPMTGYSEMREAAIWIQTKAAAVVKAEYYPVSDPSARHSTGEFSTTAGNAFTAHLIADNAEPGQVYKYEIFINGKKADIPWELKFQTQELWQWRKDPPEFSFAVGSCAYINETVYDRPGKPYGSEYEIFGTILGKKPDFMVWLGDNVYLREVDWYSRTGILKRYTHDRATKELQPLLGSVHHYAIWDDHDYGPNNSDRSFRNKHHTLEAFKLFWANPSYGINGSNSITTMFQWGDAEFFLLDNRTFRTPENREFGDRTILGKEQIEWLIDALASSWAPFKFVCMGGQFLNPAARQEVYSTFPEEWQYIKDAIRKENIPGVIFLSGDRHHSEVTKLDRPGTYPLYDFTLSSLTAGISLAKDEPNFNRVPGSLVEEHNFGYFTISGKRKERVLKLSVIGVDGRELYKLELNENELK